MVPSPDPAAWCAELPWLADLGVASSGRAAAAGASHVLATALRRPGARVALARTHDGAESIGVDLVHAAVNELLAQHALPQFATLAVAAPPDDAFVPGLAAGVLRACRGHGVPVAVPVAAAAASAQLGLTLAGTPLGALMPRPAVGDVVLALRSTGPTDGDFAALAAHAAAHGIDWSERLPNGDTVARAVLAPRASHASVLHEALRQGWPFFGVAIEGSLQASLRAALPRDVDVALDLASWRPPAPFAAWFPPAVRAAGAATCSLGCSMVVIVAEREVARCSEHFAAWNEPATPIGRIVAR